jgi:hypothetical protein
VSQGAGAIENRIAELIAATRDRGLTVAELADFAFGLDGATATRAQRLSATRAVHRLIRRMKEAGERASRLFGEAEAVVGPRPLRISVRFEPQRLRGQPPRCDLARPLGTGCRHVRRNVLPLGDLRHCVRRRQERQQHQHRDPKSGDRQFGSEVHDQILNGRTGEATSENEKAREQPRAFAAFKGPRKRSCRGRGPLKAQVERWPIALAMRNWGFYLASRECLRRSRISEGGLNAGRSGPLKAISTSAARRSRRRASHRCWRRQSQFVNRRPFDA